MIEINGINIIYLGGYSAYDNYITSFSHLHMVGAGVVDLGWIGMFPVTIETKKGISKSLNKMINKKYGYRSKFSHD